MATDHVQFLQSFAELAFHAFDTSVSVLTASLASCIFLLLFKNMRPLDSTCGKVSRPKVNTEWSARCKQDGYLMIMMADSEDNIPAWSTVSMLACYRTCGMV